MSTPPSRLPPVAPNPTHRRQVLWQIWVPLGVSLAMMLALMVLTVLGTGNPAGSISVTKWSHLSAVFLILPVLFISLMTMLVLFACVYGLNRLLGAAPKYLRVAQLYAARGAAYARHYANRAVNPVISVKSDGFAWNTLLEMLGLRKTRS